MTPREAIKLATGEASQVYRTAASPHGDVTWGFSTYVPGSDLRRQHDIGGYRKALQARAEWIKERAEALME